jgi:hypothetical protein
MSSDAEQKSILVPQHKRMAMGEKIDGTSMGSKTSAPQKKQSGLSHVVNKKNK